MLKRVFLNLKQRTEVLGQYGIDKSARKLAELFNASLKSH